MAVASFVSTSGCTNGEVALPTVVAVGAGFHTGTTTADTIISSSTTTLPAHYHKQVESAPTASNHQHHPARVIIVGDPKVGKTALIVRFLTKRFIGQYRNNADMRYAYSVDSLSAPPSFSHHHIAKYCDQQLSTNGGSASQPNRRPLLVEFVDISQTPIEDHLETSEASFVIVYNICERSSFLTAKRLVWMIRKLKEPARVPVLVIGNKKDLAETHRQVTAEEVERLGCDCDVIAVETSAAADAGGVTAAFNRLLTETRHFIDEQRSRLATEQQLNNNNNADSDAASPRRKSSLTILSSLTGLFSNRRKRRKPRTL